MQLGSFALEEAVCRHRQEDVEIARRRAPHPGFTFTGMSGRAEKPPEAWTADQVVDFMIARMAEGDFYILCPDNAVTREMDNKRMQWAMEDIIKNRPALSRWHPDHKDSFAKYMAE